MSFQILSKSSDYNFISDTLSWNLDCTFKLVQYRMKNEEMRYVLYKNLRNSETIFTTKGETPTRDELLELNQIVVKKLWFYYNEEALAAQQMFENVNDLANSIFEE